jgi:hypothetical protein
VNNANGLVAGLWDGDLNLDVAVLGPDGLRLAQGDGQGHFQQFRDLPLGMPGDFVAPGGGRVQLASGLLDADPFADLVVPAPATNRVYVLRGDGQGHFTILADLPSGGTTPIAVSVGDFVGNSRTDVAVGHRDGSVTFFEGRVGGTFVARPDRTQTGLGVITGLATLDANGDGLTDLAVSGTDRVTVVQRTASSGTALPVNGTFSSALTGWQLVGPVQAGDGTARFAEGTGLLTSLRQTLTIPAGATTLSFDFDRCAERLTGFSASRRVYPGGTLPV